MKVMTQPELLRTIRRVLIAHHFDPSRVKTGWHKHNGRGGGGFLAPGFKLKGVGRAVELRHDPNFSIDHWSFERNEAILGKYIEVLESVGFHAMTSHHGGPVETGYRGSIYVFSSVSIDRLNLACIDRRIRELRQDEQQSIRGSLNADKTVDWQRWQDHLRHDRYLLRLLGSDS